jgi:hypothetical protein
MDGRAFLLKRWARQFLANFEPTTLAGGLSKAPDFDFLYEGDWPCQPQHKTMGGVFRF